MRNSQSTCLAAALTLGVAFASVSGAFAQPSEGARSPWPFTRVRGSDPEIRRLLAGATARSATLLALVEEIQRSNAIVMISYGECAKGQIRSCVSGVEGGAAHRHIRILVNTRTTEFRLMATIAHELQHALEIIREPSAVDGPTTMALYRRIATGRCRDGLSERCETELALATERQVLDELNR